MHAEVELLKKLEASQAFGNKLETSNEDSSETEAKHI